MSAETISVAELNRRARQLLEQRFPLLWVGGEVSNLARAASGHLYFSLKDGQAQVRCAMFRSRAQLLPWKLENGQQVEAQALVTLYEARGEFQLNVEGLRRAGVGRLYEQFLLLRGKLAAEGLFDAARKRDIPPYPRRVGVVTSPQAAALADVIAAFARRAPHVELIVYPTLVQGAEAPAAIVAALTTARARAAEDRIDLLLLVRGGGGIEDLWAFNDEAVARAIAAPPEPSLSGPPIVAGIGHETDTTLADLAADRRAATPTAAAELASAGWHAIAAALDGHATRLRRAWRAALETRMQTVDRLALRLIHPAQRLAARRQRLELATRRLAGIGQRRLDAQGAALAALRLRLQRAQPDPRTARRRSEHLEQRLRQALLARLTQQRDRLARVEGALTALSPTATLRRGYSIVRDAQGAIVRDATCLGVGDALDLRFAAGAAVATVAAVATERDDGL